MGADLYIKKIEGEDGYFRDSYNNSNLLWQFGLSYWTDIEQMCEDNEKEELVMMPDKIKEFKERLKNNEPTFEKNMCDILAKQNIVWDYESKSVDDFPWTNKEKKYYKEKYGLYIKVPQSNKEKNEFKMKDRRKWVEFYREQYEGLKKFLDLALENDSPIRCSI
jgi:hypothetical protein